MQKIGLRQLIWFHSWWLHQDFITFQYYIRISIWLLPWSKIPWTQIGHLSLTGQEQTINWNIFLFCHRGYHINFYEFYPLNISLSMGIPTWLYAYNDESPAIIWLKCLFCAQLTTFFVLRNLCAKHGSFFITFFSWRWNC